MGNSSSGNLTIAVHPQQHSNPAHAGYYVAGNKINGVVYVSSNAEGGMPSNHNSSLSVYLTGRENVQVIYTVPVTDRYHEDGEEKTRTRMVTRYAYASREIVNIKIPIVSNTSNFSGRHEYPFEVSSTKVQRFLHHILK